MRGAMPAGVPCRVAWNALSVVSRSVWRSAQSAVRGHISPRTCWLDHRRLTAVRRCPAAEHQRPRRSGGSSVLSPVALWITLLPSEIGRAPCRRNSKRIRSARASAPAAAPRRHRSGPRTCVVLAGIRPPQQKSQACVALMLLQLGIAFIRSTGVFACAQRSVPSCCAAWMPSELTVPPQPAHVTTLALPEIQVVDSAGSRRVRPAGERIFVPQASPATGLLVLTAPPASPVKISRPPRREASGRRSGRS